MQLRDHPAICKGGTDVYRVDPRLLQTSPGFNIRDLEAPAAREALDTLKEQVRTNGVRVPLLIRIEGEDLFVVSGHRRLHVVRELIAEGEVIENIPAIAEAKKTGEAERAVGLVVDNAGEPLSPLEIAEVVRRLLAFGWDRQNIALRLGFKAAQTVANYEELLGLPASIREAVREGDVSATTARTIMRESAAEVAVEAAPDLGPHWNEDVPIDPDQIGLPKIARGAVLTPQRSVAEIATAKLTEGKATAKAAGKKKVTARSLKPGPSASVKRDTISVLVATLTEIANDGDGEDDRRKASQCLATLFPGKNSLAA